MSESTAAIRRHGEWPSAFSIDDVIASGLRIADLRADGGQIGWTEGRPAEQGRSTLMTLRDGEVAELTPAPWNVRSRVHEYGGGAWVRAGDRIIFSHYADSRLYAITNGQIAPITPEGAHRYADLTYDAANDRLFAVREDHTVPATEPVNTIVLLDPAGPNADGGRILISGTDFVSSPRIDATGTRLAWVAWNHPNMPWDDTSLAIATIRPDGELDDIRYIAGGDNESVMQPRFLPDGRLGFVSDRTGWWNLYVANPDGAITALHEDEAEFGTPAWTFATSDWDVVDDNTLVAIRWRDGTATLGIIDLRGTGWRTIAQPYSVLSSLHVIPGTREVAAVAASPTLPRVVVRIAIDSGQVTVLRGPEVGPDPALVAVPESISWPTPDGAIAHGFHYPPTNPACAAPEGERPPLIVISHGGPTGATTPDYSASLQFWTSRGYAILDVNYGGSTGYGRAYRQRLNGRWGIVDIGDCISGVEHLIAQGKADPERIIIRGGSAGGYTTLQALVSSTVFRVGVSYYGVGDLEALATDTHKFESRYLDSLVGPYPEAKATYIERSPIHHTERLSAAMLLLQGLEDRVVPPNQSATMAAAVRAKGLPVAHIEFAGEGHGFRGEAAQRASLEAELAFYSRIFGLKPADPLPGITIENL